MTPADQSISAVTSESASSERRCLQAIESSSGVSPADDYLTHPLLLQYMRSERLAIQRFILQLQAGSSRPVNVPEALFQWESGPSRSWRQAKMRLDGQMQLREIERHKYFVSQRVGYDIGWERAAQDWIECHAATWRQWWEFQPESSPAPCLPQVSSPGRL